ncbi:MAG: hypothetical protein JRJ19_07045 [Deltaproteobacteria bacterium]|nr:hypothetical protein [Deltaproteobacteria bacterium]MBW1871802.1 hypothetical protein [Deltaproteobacteria bacterium]
MIILKRIGPLVCIVMALTVAACCTSSTIKKTQKPPPPKPVEQGAVAIGLEVRFGISAPFSQSSVSINSAGELVYNEKVYPPAVSKRQTKSEKIKITDAQLEELRVMVLGSKLFTMGNRNNEGQDCISYGVSVKTHKDQKSFSCQCGCPDELNTIGNMIEKLLGHPMMIMGF